jgi:ketosteroid isomerase-like protein
MESETEAAMLSQADIAHMNEMTQAFAKGMLAKNRAPMATLYMDDAVLNPPHEPAVKGRTAITAWLEHFPPLTAFTLNNAQVEGREDLAYVVGSYTMTFQPPGAPAPIQDAGKYVEVRRRQADGGWLIAVDIFNSDLPVP